MSTNTTTLSPLEQSLKAILKLTRWKEHAPFVVLTLFGALIASTEHNVLVDWHILAITGANILTVAFAFMINDIEDAPDDALDSQRAQRNPITNNELSPTVAYFSCAITVAAALILYSLCGIEVLVTGAITLLFSYTYSWRKTRLKAWFPMDVISHSLMLGGLLVLSGYFTYAHNLESIWLVAVSATLGSMYGQIYNQLRDFSMDSAAGLKNTAISIGKRNSHILMYLCAAISVILMLIAVSRGIVPAWLGIILCISFLFSFLLRPKTDMRGGKAVELSGSLQIQIWIALCTTTIVWLSQVVFAQVFLT